MVSSGYVARPQGPYETSDFVPCPPAPQKYTFFQKVVRDLMDTYAFVRCTDLGCTGQRTSVFDGGLLGYSIGT